jgi:ribosomal protein S18 acetylase RimI-like enzyme
MTAPVLVRPFRLDDRPSLLCLFADAGRGSPSESLWRHLPSEAAVYLEPYADLEPESLLLAVSDDALVGYLAGCVDSSGFPSEEERFERAVRDHHLMRRPRAAGFFARSLADLAVDRCRRAPSAGELVDDRWPSHLHINVIPEFRGAGAASGLMTAWLDRLQALGSPGCYLQTLVENERAMRFFERHGFTAHGPRPPVPGVRYKGRRVHQLTMTRTLTPAAEGLSGGTGAHAG